jgi:predicted DNA-binding protein
MAKQKRINITVNDDLDEMIGHWASKYKISKSEMVRRFISVGIEDEEDNFLAERAIKRMEENPNQPTYTTKELNESLGWDDVNEELGL